MTFGNKIKSRREELGLTQSELAQRARLSQGYISILENEDYIPKSTTILVLALALEMPIQNCSHIRKKEAWFECLQKQMRTAHGA